MRFFYSTALFLWMISVNCNKESDHKEPVNKICESDLVITEVQTPRTSITADGITSNIKSYGPNLCYSFSHLEVSEKSAFVYEIRVKANAPCVLSICLQAIYQANPTLRINTPVPGTYVVKFYNVNSLFQSDTVQVN